MSPKTAKYEAEKDVGIKLYSCSTKLYRSYLVFVASFFTAVECGFLEEILKEIKPVAKERDDKIFQNF